MHAPGQEKGAQGHGSIIFEHGCAPCVDGRYHRRCRGRWRGALCEGFGPDGKRRRYKVSGRTKQDVIEALRTLLRVSGTPVGVPSRVVLMEAAVPLVAATIVAAGIAYGTSVLAFVRLAPTGTAIPQLGSDYYALMGIGLAVAFGIITVTLPLLRRMTSPGNAHFE